MSVIVELATKFPLATIACSIFLAYLLYTLLSSGPKQAEKVTKKVLKEYTYDEVSKHNKKSDLWLVIDGKVYDFTSMIDLHPGGDAILRDAGADATQGFHGPHHPGRAHEMLEDYIIGSVVGPAPLVPRS
eukprot:TRINITY_DN2068_c0_g1_i1.p2 TRINITY_DN2068_c0_g1~~TRINITY_DN2068_c0_g1_i1.p2  ORF type:complete len:130 (+),score=38.53 TRINITY_DN2068_c0_g1_i1:82-471(+)